jgi:hypothetical protein
VDRFDASTAAVSPVASSAASGLSAWGGYAQADPTLVGVLVAAIAIFAVVYVLKRVLGERRPGRSSGPEAGSKPARARSR